MSLFLAIALASLLLGLGTAELADRTHRHALRLKLHHALGHEAAHGSALDPMLQWLARQMPGTETLRGELLRAGYFRPEAAPIFALLRLVAMLGAGALVLAGRSFGPSTLLLALFCAFLCSRLFPIFLKQKAEARGRALRAELPPVIDVLLMVLHSGVSIDQCLRHAAGMIEHTAPLTHGVLKRYAADVDGGVPYETALERMGERLGSDDGHDLANLIRQALLQGGEILAPLERFGAEVAEKRVATAREQIGRKSVLLTMVMLAFFMPVLLIALAGPAVSSILDTLGTVKQELHHRGARR